MNLKDTLNLPDTRFPMRGNLVQREPERLAHWSQLDLYQRIQDKNADGPLFLLHDGPPFTNGDVHIGTALNKILKDSILRYKSMRGYRTPYLPGWDCHGLPIEHKVSKELRAKKQDLAPAQLREACADFSENYIGVQREQFKRLGVLADWEREYKTKNPAYEAEILRAFASFIEKGLIYRSKKPVYWSIPCETALAEAEIEYQDHTSPSIWVKLRVTDPAKHKLPESTYFVIWTTTPWTLPANLAIAVHPDLQYTEIKHGEDTLIVALPLADSFIADCELEGATTGTLHKGQDFEHIQTQHPFIDRASPLVLADYVTTDAGTGCVHTAPGHGLDDYHTGLKYGLEIYCPIDDHGCYVKDEWMPEELVGITVLERNGKCPANDAVLEIIKGNGSLLQRKAYHHQYPHCWRSKTPVVFRAMDQWFVSLDKDGMRDQCLQSIGQVDWIPDWGENRIRGAVETRPDWCISRQRSWGVPIPAFYDEDGNALLTAELVHAIADKVATAGTNIWFEQEAEELLEGVELPAAFAGKKLKKGTDTLDVWIDSGCSHLAVLKDQDDLSWPADLYLEGSDQHRGWFQSSLWTSMVTQSQPPYRKIITHGFIVDEKGEKISKAKGAMSSDGWVEKYGADIMRLWVSSQDFRGDIRLSENHFKLVTNTYRSIRNTFYFQLGNLYDFDPAEHAVPAGDLDPLDQWALKQTADLIEDCTRAYEQSEFHRVYQLADRFFGVTLSRIYHDILKDRLYTFGPDWKERRSSQTAIHLIFECLTRLLAPILTFTCDEAHSYSRSNADFTEGSIHLQDWPTIDPALFDNNTVAEIQQLLDLRTQVNETLEGLRKDKVIGKSLDAQVTISAPEADPTFATLQKYAATLPELFIVSTVELKANGSDTLTIHAVHAEGVRCPRSWRWVPELVSAGEYGDVSPRDRDALLAR
ncbi:MAG: isoleucine--tRNA ligase [Verrucomicrobiota bacterium]